MADASENERGAFVEDFVEDDAREADRAAPSVAEAGGGVGGRPVWMWVSMAAAVALSVWFLVLRPMQEAAPKATVLDPVAVDVDRSARAVDTAFPGTGFDLTETGPDRVAVAPRTDEPTVRERRLEREIEKLTLELQAEREKSAQQLRAIALRRQIDAAEAAEADRVKRLRSDVLIGDYTGKDQDGFGPRDLPDEAQDAEEAQDAGLAATPSEGTGDPADPLRPGEDGDEAEAVFPPRLLELMGQGAGLAPEDR